MSQFQENFLHFIWQYQYFQKQLLKTTQQEPVNILSPGFRQSDAGPDFSHARIIINDIEWHGPVEIHINSSDWYRHQHDHDATYDAVILHVVWKHDREVYHRDGSPIPVVELAGLVDERLIGRYKHLLELPHEIPCGAYQRALQPLQVHAMLDVALAERLEQKSRKVEVLYTLQKADWEASTWQTLAANFGFKVNQEAMQRLAKALPWAVLKKHLDQPVQVEALLYGQAGLLPTVAPDAYTQSLIKEYQFLSHKYELRNKQLAPTSWKFMRMRPANFPTVRIAQLAALLCKLQRPFGLFRDMDSLQALEQQLKVAQSAYWQQHYQFGKKARQSVAGLGNASVHNIIINTVVPLLFTYGKRTDDTLVAEQAVHLLSQLPPEQNHIIEKWQAMAIKPEHGADSQAMIELYRSYCSPRRCLHCKIGAALLQQEPVLSEE